MPATPNRKETRTQLTEPQREAVRAAIRSFGKQEQAEAATGIDQGMLSKFLNRKKEPGVSTARRLIEAGRLSEALFYGPTPELSVLDPVAPPTRALSADEFRQLEALSASLVGLVAALRPAR
jgi:transcriptional regulator with XRE-family HTH domain